MVRQRADWMKPIDEHLDGEDEGQEAAQQQAEVQ